MALFLNLAMVVTLATAGCASRACSSLRSTDLNEYNTTVLNATQYPVGGLHISGVVNKVALCQVEASIRYGDNDTSAFAIWLPERASYASGLMAVGNGGFAGVINWADMMTELNLGLGLAVVGSDAGHSSSTSAGVPGKYEPFLHDKDQVRAWLHDSVALYTPAAKALVKAHYGDKAKRAYFRGCSGGGGQGFSLAHFHPGLFDGIIAGCASNHFTHLMDAFLWNAQHGNASVSGLTESTVAFIQAKALETCDILDGVADKIIENPLNCTFDVASLACTSESPNTNSTCLTAPQIAAVKAIYQGPVRADSPNTHIYPGLAVGSEAGWYLPSVTGALSNAFTVPILQNLVYNDLTYSASSFNWASDVDYLDARAGPLINSVETNLSAFRSGGGKLIVFAGWADPNISPLWSLEHSEAITRDTLGSGTTIAENDFLKLVMVPGGGHCGAQIAKYPWVPAQYGFSSALIDWVEKGQQPTAGVKSWGPPNGEDRTRRLCTWPQVAKFVGGNIDDWGSYVCS